MKLSIADFLSARDQKNPPADLQDVYLLALWYDHQGNWQKAHELIQDLPGTKAAHIHAYLHRKEGDEWNAGYWYRRAGVPVVKEPLDQEW